MVVLLGWPPALLRFAAQYVQQRAWGLLRGILTVSHVMTLVLAVICGSVVYSLPVLMDISPEMGLIMKYSAVILVVTAFAIMRRRLFMGLQMVKASIALDEIVLPILVVAGMVILHVNNPASALMVYIAASFAVLIAGMLWLVRTLPREVFGSKPEYLGRYWLSVAIPIMFGGLNRIL